MEEYLLNIPNPLLIQMLFVFLRTIYKKKVYAE